MTDITPAIRAELDQTPAWWEGLYRKALENTIPTDAAHHEDHEIEEMQTYCSQYVRRYCIDCGVGIDDWRDA